MESKNYWFPTRSYGWGWGLPRAWQGWLVLATYAAAIALICVQVPPDAEPDRFALYVVAISLILVAICWLKGEPPRWRWGGK